MNMSAYTLREHTNKTFADAMALIAGRPALSRLHGVLQECRERLDQPMRVAIVGLIKAGKSTTMNALLGETVVATGTVEATFNVNWLKWDVSPSLLIHYKGNRQPERRGIEDLFSLTLRADDDRDHLRSIAHIDVFYPNLLLKTFSLIDTPGLASFYEDDSQNTKDFLKLYGQELSESTRTQASKADAVLYLFSHGVRLGDKTIIEQFQGSAIGQPTPINAIGVLTRIDSYWTDKNDPLAIAHDVAQRVRDLPGVRQLFYTVCPVAGLLAEGAQSLRDDDFATLTQLAGLTKFDHLIRNVDRFTRENPEISVPATQRQQLLKRLGSYGVALAVALIRAGSASREDLIAELLRRSGIPELRDLIVSHFGNRAFLIKLGTSLRQIEAACFHEQLALLGDELELVEQIAGKFEELEVNQHAFSELRCLRSHYEGRLEFSDSEVRQLLELTGEYGTSVGERLGLGEHAGFAEMQRVSDERLNYWQRKANDFTLANRETIEAINVLAQSCGLLCYRVKKAQHYLYG
jgi:GTPase SAR1 family protein